MINMMFDNLEINYKILLARYTENAAVIDNYWGEIKKRYSGSSRYYHNLNHLTQMFLELEPVKDQVVNIDCLSFAIFYHDIIYKATRKDNEHLSALFFQKRIAKTSFDRVPACMAQIEATKEHKLSKDKDTNILLDLDLAILGQSTVVYQNYAKNIRKEYKIYPDFMYKKGRLRALKHLLEGGQIFKTEYFVNKYEQQARANIKAELVVLGH